MNRVIIVMAKVPIPGTVKTRLQPHLSSDQCAALAKAFLLDAITKSKTVCQNVILAYSPPEKINVLREFLPARNVLIEQTGGDLGQRMCNAFQFAFAQNPDSVVLIGTDSPTFHAEFIESAFDFLESKIDVVLGKTADGGFYLIGLKTLHEKIFERVSWSTAATFAQTAANISRLNLRLRQIPDWYDVDEPADLARLEREFSISAAARKTAAQTYLLLRKS